MKLHIQQICAAAGVLVLMAGASLSACSDPPENLPIGDAGARDAQSTPPVVRDSAVTTLTDAAPRCGAPNASCCSQKDAPVNWSSPGERCVAGFACQAEACRSTEVGKACTAARQCPRGGVCEPIGLRAGGAPSSACTTPCTSEKECTAGWSCDAPAAPTEAGAAGRVCRCSLQAKESCNGKDDDCDGIVDGLGASADCATRLQAPMAACCNGAACIDLASDGKNCGSCGHDCLGGACRNGACEPVVASSAFDITAALLVGAGGRVVWSTLSSCPGGDKRAVVQCAAFPCAAPELVAEGVCDSSPFATRGFWPSAAAIDLDKPGRIVLSVANGLSGVSGTLFIKEPGAALVKLFPSESALQPRVNALVLERATASSKARLFWGDSSGNVRRCNLDDCASTLKTLRTGTDSVEALLLDDSQVYFGTRGASQLGDVIRCPKSGCISGGEAIATLQPFVSGLALVGERLFWASRGATSPFFTDGGLRSCPRTATGCAPLLSSILGAPIGVTADQNFAYVSSLRAGIARCAVDDCSNPEIIAQRRTTAFGGESVAQDAASIFYFDGALQRLAKLR